MDGALYNLTMEYYMVFNGPAPDRVLSTSLGKYAGEDNRWALSLIYPTLIEFDQSIMKYPSIKRLRGGASKRLDT